MFVRVLLELPLLTDSGAAIFIEESNAEVVFKVLLLRLMLLIPTRLLMLSCETRRECEIGVEWLEKAAGRAVCAIFSF